MTRPHTGQRERLFNSLDKNCGQRAFQALVGSRRDLKTGNMGSIMGKGRALNGAYRNDPSCAPIHLSHLEPGAAHGFTDDRLDTAQQACFLVVVTACLETSEVHF